METRTTQLVKLALEGDPSVPADTIDSKIAMLTEDPTPIDSGLLPIPDTCQYLGNISRFTLHRIVQSGDLRCVRIRGRRMFDVDDLRAFIAKQRG